MFLPGITAAVPTVRSATAPMIKKGRKRFIVGERSSASAATLITSPPAQNEKSARQFSGFVRQELFKTQFPGRPAALLFQGRMLASPLRDEPELQGDPQPSENGFSDEGRAGHA